MKRWLFNLAAAVSLVLCLAMGALWMRSIWIDDWLCYYDIPRRTYQMNSRDGVIVVGSHRGTWLEERGWLYESKSWEGTDFNTIGSSRFGGFKLSTVRVFGGDIVATGRWAMCPHWFVCLVTAIPPLYWAFKHRRRVRLGAFCPTCGYDLRATPQRCPECGTAVTPPSGIA